MEAKNLEEEESKNLSGEQERLESLYGHPLALLEEEEKSEIIESASRILGKDGETEVKRLILEKRLPVIVGDDGNWYTDWYPEEYLAPVARLLFSAMLDYENYPGKSSSPEYDLRYSLVRAIIRKKNQLIPLALQLRNESEHSRVLERQIDCLDQLNTDLPFSPEQLTEILN